MKELFFSRRLKQYKMKLWEWLHFKNIYESILEGNFKIDGNTKVLILTEAEIVAFRKKGYDVEIVKKISPSYPRRIVTIGYKCLSLILASSVYTTPTTVCGMTSG